MQEDILQSVVEITGNRDLDSLEYSLLATLAEIVPMKQISIYKIFSSEDGECIEEAVRLSVEAKDGESANYQWSDQAIVVTGDQKLKECIDSRDSAIHHLDNGLHRMLIPINNEASTVGALGICGAEDILESSLLIKSFVKIYENYQIILNESEHDKLTGLFNRRTFDKKLGRLLKAQKQNRSQGADGHVEKRGPYPADSSAWLVVLDFDGFKQINDTYGHMYGDEVLLILSQKMKQCFRKSDLLFRFGGDEFVIILEPVSHEKAENILEHFRSSVEAHEFPRVGRITISTGFARIKESDYPPMVLERADKALYFAKQNGRNCTFNYETLLSSGKLKDQVTSGSIDLF